MVVTGKHSAKASGALDDLTEVLTPGKNFLHCIRRDYGKPPALFLRGSGGFGGREKAALWWESEEALLGRGEGHSRAGGQPWA